jgi:hypothetical protein
MRQLSRRHIMISASYFTVKECDSLLEIAKRSTIIWDSVNFKVDGKGTQIIDPRQYQSRFYSIGINYMKIKKKESFIFQSGGMIIFREFNLFVT